MPILHFITCVNILGHVEHGFFDSGEFGGLIGFHELLLGHFLSWQLLEAWTLERTAVRPAPEVCQKPPRFSIRTFGIQEGNHSSANHEPHSQAREG